MMATNAGERRRANGRMNEDETRGRVVGMRPRRRPASAGRAGGARVGVASPLRDGIVVQMN